MTACKRFTELTLYIYILNILLILEKKCTFVTYYIQILKIQYTVNLMYIFWNSNPVMLEFGDFELRWYSFFWVVGLLIAVYTTGRIFKSKRLSEENFNRLFTYCFLGIFIGARLGHCFFYDWEYFSQHLAEIILPVRFLPDGSWKFIGYAGLASHGGTLGLILALVLYCRKTKMHFLEVADIIALATPVTAGCIRIANLMNSEIIGIPTRLPWAFVFERVDMEPRHPAQLYEALAYFCIGLLMWYLYRKQQGHLQRGFFFGLCLTAIFVFRFFVEFVKENQESFEEGMMLNMGQWLSVPFVAIGIYFMIQGYKKENI